MLIVLTRMIIKRISEAHTGGGNGGATKRVHEATSARSAHIMGNRTMTMSGWRMGAALAAIAGSGAAGAWAQEGAPQDDDPLAVEVDGELVLLETITVTARRREESLQDVPQSVAVLSGVEIDRSNLSDIRDYVAQLPNVNFTGGSQPFNTQVSVRGLSNLIAGSASGPSTGIYVDEVLINAIGGTNGIDLAVFDFERIEVAFGPQGTTFGRGSVGGAINLVTRKPTSDFEAELSLEGGSFPDGEVRGIVNARFSTAVFSTRGSSSRGRSATALSPPRMRRTTATSALRPMAGGSACVHGRQIV